MTDVPPKPDPKPFPTFRYGWEELTIHADGRRMGPRESVRVYFSLFNRETNTLWAAVPAEAFVMKPVDEGREPLPTFDLSRDEARTLYEALGQALGYQSALTAHQIISVKDEVIAAKDDHLSDMRSVIHRAMPEPPETNDE